MRKQTSLWTQRDGERIRVCDMGDGHLLATLKMLERYAMRKKHSSDMLMLGGPQLLGEHAQDAFDCECDDVWDTPWEEYLPPIYFAMQKDAQRRGLEFERHDRIDGDERRDR